MKVCQKCHAKKDLTCFYSDRSREDGKHPYCADCKKCSVSQWRKAKAKEDISAWRKRERERQRRFRLAHPDYEANQRKSRAVKINKSTKEYSDRYPEKRAARWAVANALRSGKLVKKPCEVCGSSRVDAHHYKGYAKEHRLAVQWLCRMHHMAEDRLKA